MRAFQSYHTNQEVNQLGLQFFRLYQDEMLDVLLSDRQELLAHVWAFNDIFGEQTQELADRLIDADERECYLIVSQMLHHLLMTEKGTLAVDAWVQTVRSSLHAVAHGKGIDIMEPRVRTFVKFFMRDHDPKFLQKIVASLHVDAIIDQLKAKKRSYQFFLDEYEKAYRIRRLDMIRGQEKQLDSRFYSKELDHRFFARLFIRCLPKCNLDEGAEEDWVYDLVALLRRDARNRAMLRIFMPDYALQLEVRRQREIQATHQDFSIELEEEGQEVTECTPQSEANSEMYDQWLMLSDLPQEEIEWNLRTYQSELAMAACQGKNTVIVAPTGSGKTRVAAYVADQHFRRRKVDGKPSRVVFVVPSVPLVEQQQRAFQDLFEGRLIVIGLHGASAIGDQDDRKKLLLGAHITVITPQLLVNMLQSVRRSERIYICDLTMIILDECHYTTKESAYNVLMDMVQEYKHAKPQIVGMSASLGTGDQPHNVEQVCQYIYTLCGAMGCQQLSTVQRYKDELNKFVPMPEDEVKHCTRVRGPHTFYHTLWVQTENYQWKVQCMLKELTKSPGAVFSEHEIALDHAFKCVSRYVGVLANLLDKTTKQSNLPTQLRMDLIAGLEVLRICANTFLLDEVMPSFYAYEYLVKAFKAHAGAHQYYSSFWENDFQGQLIEAIRKEKVGEKQILSELESRIRHQLESKPDSRIIIFVNERSSAHLLSTAINKHPFFDRLRQGVRGDIAGYATGTSAKNKGATNAQTVQEQSRMLYRFKEGELKMLVATNVLQEGVDVQTCNLIIKYNVTGNVISEVQKRGRARAVGSKSVLLAVTESVEQREMENKLGEMFMDRAAKIISRLNETEFTARCEQARQERIQRKAQELMEQMKLQTKNLECTLKCMNCEATLGPSMQMRVIMNLHYVLCHEEIWERILFEPERRTKTFGDTALVLGKAKCANIVGDGPCNQHLGYVLKYADSYHVQLTLRSLLIIDDQTGDPSDETRRKWASVRTSLFWIRGINDGDLKRMLRPLPQKLMRSFVEAEEALKQEMKQQLSRRRERLARGQQPLLEWDDDYDMKRNEND